MSSSDIDSQAVAADIASAIPHTELIVPELAADNKIAAIKELADRLLDDGIIDDNLGFLQAVLERESLQSTVIADGEVALPHARGRMVRRLGLAVGRCTTPIEFPSGNDRHAVSLICLIAVPANAPGLYLKLLAALARVFDDASFRAELRHADSPVRMHQLLARQMETTNPIPSYPFRS